MPELSRLDAAYLHIHHAPWAIRPEAFEGLLESVRVQADAEPPEDLGPVAPSLIDESPDVPEPPEDRMPRLPRTDKAIAVISVHGVIGQRRGSDYWASAYSQEIASQMLDMATNQAVGAIVLDIDSPGGLASGMRELAVTMRAVREIKPVYAISNPMAASAAYYLGSQATKMFATPSWPGVGSVGVIWPHLDLSEALANEGVKITYTTYGKYKSEGNSTEPLGDEAAEERQRVVDQLGGEFVADVAAGRNTDAATVRNTFGEGRMVAADEAKKLGMVDGVCTLNELLVGLLPPPRGRTRGAAAALAIEDEAGHAIGKID